MGLEKIIQFGKDALPIGKYAKKVLKAVGTASLLVALASTPAYASEKYYQPNKNKDEIYQEVVLGNCLLQGVISGFGGMQNGKPYWKSFAKGCLGGALIAGGKIAVGNGLNNAWPAKITTALGTSIAYNASSGKPMDDSFGIDFGPAYFELKKNEFGNYKFKAYLLPDSLGYELFYIANGAKLDAESSLKYGTPVFNTERLFAQDAAAVTGGNNIAKVDDKEVRRRSPYYDDKYIDELRESALRHELIHTMQYSSSRSFGNVVLNASRITKDLQAFFEDYHIYLNHAIGHHLLQSADLFYKYNSETPQEREAYDLAGK